MRNYELQKAPQSRRIPSIISRFTNRDENATQINQSQEPGVSLTKKHLNHNQHPANTEADMMQKFLVQTNMRLTASKMQLDQFHRKSKAYRRTKQNIGFSIISSQIKATKQKLRNKNFTKTYNSSSQIIQTDGEQRGMDLCDKLVLLKKVIGINEFDQFKRQLFNNINQITGYYKLKLGQRNGVQLDLECGIQKLQQNQVKPELQFMLERNLKSAYKQKSKQSNNQSVNFQFEPQNSTNLVLEGDSKQQQKGKVFSTKQKNNKQKLKTIIMANQNQSQLNLKSRLKSNLQSKLKASYIGRQELKNQNKNKYKQKIQKRTRQAQERRIRQEVTRRRNQGIEKKKKQDLQDKFIRYYTSYQIISKFLAQIAKDTQKLALKAQNVELYYKIKEQMIGILSNEQSFRSHLKQLQNSEANRQKAFLQKISHKQEKIPKPNSKSKSGNLSGEMPQIQRIEELFEISKNSIKQAFGNFDKPYLMYQIQLQFNKRLNNV